MIYLIEEDPAHPGAGAAEASIAGGPKVWQLVEYWRANNRNDRSVADHYDLPLATVHIVLWYYAAHYRDINARIRRNQQQTAAITELAAIAQEMGMYD
jgi:uncharacterized protein (DUF433 family)